MQSEIKSTDGQALLAWEAPLITSTEAFTKAALACCEIAVDNIGIGEYEGSSAANSSGLCP